MTADEFPLLADIERFTKQIIPRKGIEGFEPVHALPESRLDSRPIKPKKPKKPRVQHRDGQRSGDNARGHHSGNRRGNGPKNASPRRSAS